MDPNIGKTTIGKERTVAECKESLPTSRGPHRNRFLEVQAEIRARMASDKKTLLAEANASAKRNLISVGGCADTPVHVDSCSRALSCFCNGQTILSEGHGWGRQEGYLVSDGGFFQGSGGQGFEQDEGTV